MSTLFWNIFVILLYYITQWKTFHLLAGNDEQFMLQ